MTWDSSLLKTNLTPAWKVTIQSTRRPLLQKKRVKNIRQKSMPCSLNRQRNFCIRNSCEKTMPIEFARGYQVAPTSLLVGQTPLLRWPARFSTPYILGSIDIFDSFVKATTL